MSNIRFDNSISIIHTYLIFEQWRTYIRAYQPMKGHFPTNERISFSIYVPLVLFKINKKKSINYLFLK